MGYALPSSPARTEPTRAAAGSHSTPPTLAAEADPRYDAGVPEWRNWQTRGTQNPVRLKPSAGSTPASGTIFQRVRYSAPPAHYSRHAQIVLLLCLFSLREWRSGC